MPDINYQKSHDYEGFIRLARLSQTERLGCHYSYMNNLLNAEKGQNHTRSSRGRLLLDVKKYMTSALKFAVKRRLSKSDKDVLASYLPLIETASTGSELLEICNNGIEILVKYKSM